MLLSAFRCRILCRVIDQIQWCKSVAKYGVRVSQVKPSNCFRRLEQLVLGYLPFLTRFSHLMWNLQSYPTTAVLNEIMWHFQGVYTYSDPSDIFMGRDPLKDLCPWVNSLTAENARQPAVHAYYCMSVIPHMLLVKNVCSALVAMIQCRLSTCTLHSTSRGRVNRWSRWTALF